MRTKILLICLLAVIVLVAFIAKYEADHRQQQEIIHAIAEAEPLPKNEQQQFHFLPASFKNKDSQ